jgi:hypothetical protein
MSQIASLSPTSAAFPPINTHARGHKHGSQLDSTDSPTGAVQNLFGSLLQTAEKVVGLQSGATSAAIAAGTAAGTAVANAAAKIGGAVSTHSASTLLQNYLNNLSHKPQSNGLQAQPPAGSRINADA